MTSVVDYPITVHAGRNNVTGLRANFVVATAKEGYGTKENPRAIFWEIIGQRMFLDHFFGRDLSERLFGGRTELNSLRRGMLNIRWYLGFGKDIDRLSGRRQLETKVNDFSERIFGCVRILTATWWSSAEAGRGADIPSG